MKHSAFALIAVAAAVCAPVAANASVHKHRALRHVAYHSSVRAAYGMYEPAGSQGPHVSWSSGNAAVDGNNANSMSGSNSAPENPASGG